MYDLIAVFLFNIQSTMLVFSNFCYVFKANRHCRYNVLLCRNLVFCNSQLIPVPTLLSLLYSIFYSQPYHEYSNESCKGRSNKGYTF